MKINSARKVKGAKKWGANIMRIKLFYIQAGIFLLCFAKRISNFRLINIAYRVWKKKLDGVFRYSFFLFPRDMFSIIPYEK